MVYLVTWDLNKENSFIYQQKRNVLIDRFRRTQQMYDPGLDSVRFVDSALSAGETYRFLANGILDENDRMVVAQVTEAHCHLEPAVVAWISSRQ